MKSTLGLSFIVFIIYFIGFFQVGYYFNEIIFKTNKTFIKGFKNNESFFKINNSTQTVGTKALKMNDSNSGVSLYAEQVGLSNIENKSGYISFMYYICCTHIYIYIIL